MGVDVRGPLLFVVSPQIQTPELENAAADSPRQFYVQGHSSHRVGTSGFRVVRAHDQG